MDGNKPVNEPNEEKVFDPFEIEPQYVSEKASGGAGIAWLALLVAVLAAGGSAYLWWLDWQAGSEASDQLARVESMAASQSGLAQSLQALESRLAAVEQDDTGSNLAALSGSVNRLEQRISGLDQQSAENEARDQTVQAALFDLQQALTSAEATLAAVTARSDTPGQRLDMYEVESLLRLASERLQLFADVAAADEALALADERLAAMGDPVYLSVRQRIARARQALAAIELPDPVLIEGRLSALQAQVPLMPFPGEVIEQPEAPASPPDGLWERFKQTLSGLVTVRRRTSEDALTIGDKDYLRQGLWLQLETARLSMTRRDSAAYRAALDRSADTLNRYFDGSASAVQSAVSEIDQLSKFSLEAQLPDISGPWSQLNLLRQAPAPVAEQDADDASADTGDMESAETSGDAGG